MKPVFAFIFAACVMGALSLPYESWGLPVWPVALMTLLAGAVLSLIPGLEKYRLWLLVLYFTVFALLWLQSFPRPITPKATLFHLRGLVWMATYSIFGITAAFAILITLVKSHSDPKGRRAAIYAMAAIMMAAIVAFVSGPGAGADPMLAWLRSLGFSQSLAEGANLVVRKLAHFTFYGTMALMAGLAAYHGRDSRGVKPAIIGFTFMLIHAVFDEVRQSGVSIRTGSWIDVLIDSFGAAVFLWLAIGRRRKAEG
jgi:VanZ family protein